MHIPLNPNAPYTIFWFRQDLRIFDNLGLFEAAKIGPVIPIYIWDEDHRPDSKTGAASKWWLHHSLNYLNHSLDNNLNVYKGLPQEVINHIINTHPVKAVYWNRCYEPWRVTEDAKTKILLKERGTECKSFNSSLLWEPFTILKADKTPYKVYSAFYQNGCLKSSKPRELIPRPEKLILIKDHSNPTTLDHLNLLGSIPWHSKLEHHWDVGEKAAQKKLMTFLNSNLKGYKENRNYPAMKAVSRLSPHLHFGEISPHQIWHTLDQEETCQDKNHFLSEIAWREFSYYLLYHFPTLPYKNFRPQFDRFPWEKNALLLKAWQKGKTGYPIVDAGMRELWQTGYMHNRVRMIAGSFLVKNLLLHWHHGRDWFWDCLVDADLANNSASWQWVAGSGVDAAPYFRIFNPVTQGEKFDPTGLYTRHFVPELSKLPDQYLFKPWEASPEILKNARIILGKDYPTPIVDMKKSRQAALAAYKTGHT